MNDLVAEIEKQLERIAPKNLNKVPHLRRENTIKSIHSSAAIEGNTLSIEQVTAVIDGKRVLGKDREIREIKNYFDAYELINEINPYNMNDMLKTHRTMMEALVDECGTFRTTGVGVFDKHGKPVHIAPPASTVPVNMKNLFNWLTHTTEHPLIVSSIFHYEFEYIHPFQDGNGRMGRFWQTTILTEWNPVFAFISAESIVRKRQIQYYAALRESDKQSDCNVFIIFMLESILEAVKEVV